MKYFICPNCGEDVKLKAKACPHCGSDNETGWSSETYLDGLDIPEDNYEELVQKEFGVTKNIFNARNIVVTVIAFVLLLLFLMNYVVF